MKEGRLVSGGRGWDGGEDGGSRLGKVQGKEEEGMCRQVMWGVGSLVHLGRNG